MSANMQPPAPPITSAALLAARSTALYHVEPERLRIIGRDTEDGPEHDLWDDHALLDPYEEYVLSMMAFGVMVPVICTVIDGVAFIVDGRRRIVAAREANKRLAAKSEPPITVPVVAKDGRRVSNATFSIVLNMLNEIRRDDPPDVKMRKAARLHKRGVKQQMIAVAFGVTQACVSGWLAAAAASPEVRQAIDTGEISVATATKLSALPAGEQAKALETLTEQKPTAARAAAVVRAARTKTETRERPSLGRLRVILAAPLSEDFLRGVRYVLGELDPAEVPGLEEAHAAPIPLYRRGVKR